MNILHRDFYNRDSLVVANELLGKYLVHNIEGVKLVGKIVETEAYRGPEDKAAHSYGGRRTPRVEVMYGPAGYAYVYLIYGMYNCFNVVTNKEGTPHAVLVRGIEPMGSLDEFAQNRYQKSYKELNKSQIKALSNGPGKLCQALLIDRAYNGEDLCRNRLYITTGNDDDFEIISAKRVGIDYAEEAKDFLWRFYIKDNSYVSVV